jgi:hypothetical protein
MFVLNAADMACLVQRDVSNGRELEEGSMPQDLEGDDGGAEGEEAGLFGDGWFERRRGFC